MFANSHIFDFRQTNIDAGGQGAPLTGFFHEYLNSSSAKPITFLNLGGFANLSIKDGKNYRENKISAAKFPMYVKICLENYAELRNMYKKKQLDK